MEGHSNDIQHVFNRLPEGALERVASYTETAEGYYSFYGRRQLRGLNLPKILREFPDDEISDCFEARTNTALDARSRLNSAIHEATQDLPPTTVRFHLDDLSGKKKTDDGKKIIYLRGGIQNFLRKYNLAEPAKAYRQAVQEGYDEMLFWTAERKDFHHILGYITLLEDPQPAQSFLATYFKKVTYVDSYMSDTPSLGFTRDAVQIHQQERIREAAKNYGQTKHNRALQKRLLNENTGIIGAGVIAVQSLLKIGHMHHASVALEQIERVSKMPDIPTQLAIRALHKTPISNHLLEETTLD